MVGREEPTVTLNLLLANETITIPTALARQSQILRQMMTVNVTEYIGSYDLLRAVLEVMLTDGRIDPTMLNHPGLRAELRRHGIDLRYPEPSIGLLMAVEDLWQMPVAVLYHKSGRFRQVIDPFWLTLRGLELSSDAIFVPIGDLPKRPPRLIGSEVLDLPKPIVDLFELNDALFDVDGDERVIQTTIEGGVAPTSFTTGSVEMVKLGTGKIVALNDLFVRVIPHDQHKIPYPNAWMLSD